MKKIYIYSLLIFLISTSCRTVSFVQFQVLESAEVNLPEQVKSFSVVNNHSFQNKYCKIIHKKKKNIDYKLLNIDTAKIQSLTTNQIVKNLTDMLNDSPLYNNAVLVNSNSKTNNLTWDEVASICEKNKTDALISLEAFIHDDSASFVSYYSDYGYVYYTFLNFKVTTIWRIYYPKERKIIDRDINFADVPFDAYAYSFKGSIKEMASDTVISDEIANYAANNFFRRISPAWSDCSRMYFTGSSNMIKAINYVEKNDWTKASDLWKFDLDNRNKRIAGDATYNIALAYEMDGDIEEALIWAKKSFQKYNNKWALDYIKKLEKRLKEQVKLNKQFAGEQVKR
ncbi:MAG: hypothetical protein IMY72_12525 [Bacteroidetes bacterium]|nr:hypothetical protein [Bacteroidota bacterium]